MCVVSMIMDHYGDKWQQYPQNPFQINIPYVSPITPAEIKEFRELLDRAREYDKKHNEPHCELEEKKEKVRKLAKELGVEVDFV